MSIRRHSFVVCLTASLVALSACSSSDRTPDVASTDSVADSIPSPTDDTVLVAVEGASECATALAAFSAVSNILMSGLAKPSSFESERYMQNLELTGGVITPEISADYDLFLDGYGKAGDALTTAREVGAGTVKGEEAVDQASAILNDASVTAAAQKVASFLANDCGVSR